MVRVGEGALIEEIHDVKTACKNKSGVHKSGFFVYFVCISLTAQQIRNDETSARGNCADQTSTCHISVRDKTQHGILGIHG